MGDDAGRPFGDDSSKTSRWRRLPLLSLFLTLVEVEFGKQILSGPETVAEIGVGRKKLALTLRTGSQSRSLVHVFQDEEEISIRHSCPTESESPSADRLCCTNLSACTEKRNEQLSQPLSL